MTDLHTHILPGMDDGARNADDSLSMLRTEWAQGVNTVVLTPHYYCEEESVSRFLERRAKSFQQLKTKIDALSKEEQADIPRLILGAEVAWHSELSECENLSSLCIEGTKNMLLELPFVPWNIRMFNRIYDLIGQTGIVPVIVHLERYMRMQKPELLAEVFELGVPVQISSEILMHPLARGKVMKLLERKRAHLLASDCHDCTRRPPNLSGAMQVVRHKLGDWCGDELERCADELAGACD